MSAAPIKSRFPKAGSGPKRRDFLFVATGAAGAVAAGSAAWPFIDNMNPAADVRAVSKIEISLSRIEPGQRLTVGWRGKPLFIDRRTPKQVAQARADDDSSDLIDPATDASRVKRPEWLIVIGVCTHLGCIPLGQGDGDPVGRWGGWYCPCHGSQYDTSGRVRRGPAPKNLAVPPYEFLGDEVVQVG